MLFGLFQGAALMPPQISAVDLSSAVGGTDCVFVPISRSGPVPPSPCVAKEGEARILMLPVAGLIQPVGRKGHTRSLMFPGAEKIRPGYDRISPDVCWTILEFLCQVHCKNDASGFGLPSHFLQLKIF